MNTIGDEALEATVSTLGAELQSVRSRRDDLEYIWQGDPESWPARAPFLFPVVGKQIGGRYSWEGREYSMPMHGFARDEEFGLIEAASDYLVYLLSPTEKSRSIYPFDFGLAVSYRLRDARLGVGIRVDNHGRGDMPFTLGTHTSFKVPLLAEETLEDYEIVFERKETASKCLVRDRLIVGEAPFLRGQQNLRLGGSLFDEGALIFKKLASKRATLTSRSHSRGVELSFADFPFLTLWALPGAHYVCIEPWLGSPSSRDDSPEFSVKDACRILAPGESAYYSFELLFF